MRIFDTGASRDRDESKLDYDACLSPLALKAFAEYMHKHCQTANGERSCDDWKKGIPLDSYAKSACRHFIAFWSAHNGHPSDESIDDALCALLFNIQGYLHERIKMKPRP